MIKARAEQKYDLNYIHQWRDMVPELKSLFPDTKLIHYCTDSPSLQYRNKYMFDIALHHDEIFGVKARWNYFEAGHGKGPCDDAREFYSWACSQKKSIVYDFYSTEDYEEASKELEQRNLKPVPGTMKLHAVFPKHGVIHIADVSCYCKRCLEGEPCDHWYKESDRVVQDKKSPEHSGSTKGRKRAGEQGKPDDSAKRAKNDKVSDTTTAKDADVNRSNSKIATIGMYVLVEYDKCIYPAMVMEVDEDESEALVSFMEPAKGKGERRLFRWSSKDDELWVYSQSPRTNPLCKK